MAKVILTLATTILLAGLAVAQPDGRMAPGSGSGSAPGSGATTPGYEAKGDRPGSGSTGREGDEPRGSIGAGRVEPGVGGAPGMTSSTTIPRPRP
jgi:hypothetical protein